MSSPTSNGNNKRKADVLSGGGPTGNGGGSGRPTVIARLKDAKSVSDPDPSTIGKQHIPPPVWGHVLDYMPYEEVRSALLIGKIIANEAVKYVRSLNFMKSCQLDVPSARRFQNVEEVNCLSLVRTEGVSIALCTDTTIRLVPLLGTYSKLERIFVGGLIGDSNRRVVYNPNQFHSISNNDPFKALCMSFLGAFKARLLPPTISKLEGMLECMFGDVSLCSASKGRGMCETCKGICSYFPMQLVYKNFFYFCKCVDDFAVYETIAQRKGARELFRANSQCLARLLNYRLLDEFNGGDINSKEEEEALRSRLEKLGITSENKVVCYVKRSDLNILDRYISLGFDPRAVSKEDLHAVIQIGMSDRHFDVYAKATFDALVARGFALDEADLIVLDERVEPALKGLTAKINEE